MKKKKFPSDVARFFNPIKSGTNGNLVTGGTHQREKRKQSSYIPVYQGGGTAIKVVGKNGNITYK